jgi:hypothetical protein
VTTRIRWYLPPLLLATVPLIVVIGANLGTMPLRTWVIARALLAAAAATAMALLALRLVWRDFAARAAWLCWFLIFFNLYGASARGLRVFGLQIWARDPLYAVPYVFTTAVIAAIASRPWERRRRDAVPMTIAAGLFVLVGLLPAGTALQPARGSSTTKADALMASTLSTPAAPDFEPSRDIHYLVLDSLGRAETVRRTHGADLSGFVAALRARGFYVADGARSNYAQTYLSLASTLNMGYLDDIAGQMGPNTTSRDVLGYLIEENVLMRMASRAGYRVVGIGSDYPATQRFPHADVCVCSLSGLDEIETAAIAQTPLAAAPLDLLPSAGPHAAHRRKVLDALDALTRYGGGRQPTFVFAHIMAPHAPYVFARDGTPVLPPSEFSLGESDDADGYAPQADYVLARTLAIVDTLLQRSGPRPAIVIHGDHGPGRGLASRPTDPRLRMRERMEIFAAYHFPEGAEDLYPTITPVNGTRLLARHYLGVELPLLPDRSTFSPLERPYDLVSVP